MQLVPLSTDGRVTVVVTAPLPPGPLRVALRLDAENVVIETLGPAGARRIGRFTAADAAAYRPVLAELAARGQVGTCPARMVHGGAAALILHLGAPARCAPVVPVPLTAARTARLRAAVPTVCAARPRNVARPRTAVAPARDDRIPAGAAPARRVPLPARPPARPGQPDDPPPQLTAPQRRRVMWATLVVAAALLLACVLQPGTSAVSAPESTACAEDSATCAP